MQSAYSSDLYYKINDINAVFTNITNSLCII